MRLIANRYSIYCLLLFIAVFSTSLKAQQNHFLNREWSLDFEKENSILSSDTSKNNFHSAFKPSITPLQITSKDTSKHYIRRKFSTESFISIRDSSDNFHLTVDPLFNFEFGKDLQDTAGNLFNNTRGFLAKGGIGENFHFQTSFYENQSTFVRYINNYIESTEQLFPGGRIVPGQGRAKDFKTNGYDYAMTSGYVSYSPKQFLNIQLGQGKHFIGDGYRSLILSDNAHNYPYARITTTFKNFQYTNLYAVFMNLTDGGVTTPPHIERLFQKKTASYQMLTYNFKKRLQLGIMQAMIWEAADSNNVQNVNFNTFNPVIGVNSLVYGLGGTNNMLLGATAKLKINNSFSIYGQFVLDDEKDKDDINDVNKKHGYQLGAKYFDAFTIKNLHLQAEFNLVRPYTYSTNNVTQSYTHFNQSLAHPLGANFKEVVAFANYKIKKFFIQAKFNYAEQGGSIYDGENPLLPQLGNNNNVLSTLNHPTKTSYQDIHVGYLINSATNMSVLIGFINRTSTINKFKDQTQYVYFGFRTSLRNLYYDF